MASTRPRTTRTLVATTGLALAALTAPAGAAPQPDGRNSYSPGSLACGTRDAEPVTFNRGQRSPAAFVSDHGLVLLREVRTTYVVTVKDAAGNVLATGGGTYVDSFAGGVHPGTAVVTCAIDFTVVTPLITLTAADGPFLVADGIPFGDGEGQVGVGDQVVLAYDETGIGLAQAAGKR